MSKRERASRELPPPSAGSSPAAAADILLLAQEDLPTAPARLHEILEALGADQVETTAKLEQAEQDEESNILDASDEELDLAAQTIDRLRRRGRRLARFRERVIEQLETAETAEVAEKRKTIYAAAEARAREVEEWIREQYATHALAIVEGLHLMQQIAGEIDAANADRPDGAPLIDLEAFRILPGTPDTVTYETGAVYYVDDFGREIVPTESEPLGVHPDSGQFWIRGTRVRARHREEPLRVPGRQAAIPRPLAAAVHLPGVEYGASFWPPRSKAWGP